MELETALNRVYLVPQYRLKPPRNRRLGRSLPFALPVVVPAPVPKQPEISLRERLDRQQSQYRALPARHLARQLSFFAAPKPVTNGTNAADQ